MAYLPAHISGSNPFESPFLDRDISSPPFLPIYPTLRPIKEPPRRTPSPPAPTIYLTGYRCHASDPEYRYAREKTGEIQPYWFDEAHGAADFNEGVRRRARNNMAPHEDEVVVIGLNDEGKEMDRVAARGLRERARERALMREEGEWRLGGYVDMSGEIGGNDLEDRIMIREEQWEQLEAERESLQEERKKLNVNETEEKRQEKEEQHARRVLIRDRALGLLDFQKNTKLKGKSKVEIAERQNVNVDSLHIPGLSSSKDNIPVLTEPQYSPAGEGLPPPPPLTVRNPDLPQMVTQEASTPTRGRGPTRRRAPTPPSLKSSTTTETDIDDHIVPVPENSGLVRDVGTLERQVPENSGLVQDFGTLERARARRADSNRFFACCVGRRK
ncbi:hypothetical protein GT037_004873 [Alternaria burnsii]|uniref:Uncharacterized protein n=1 Tax=Alternaria burnsii TaxID=1187904 RepID=A0A8H7B5C1_9PLEO|nr:uncharacterized protein GT037_004873 [Alternaria burnsii]KAF7676661.1 hypothetical protein GT037_004873 [Alternaria burnsii]